MSDGGRRGGYREVKTSKPGDRVLRVRTRKRRLAFIERGARGALESAVRTFVDIFTETPLLPVIGFLVVLVLVVPVPLLLAERSAADADITTYWIGLWWAVSAFTTVGHSDVDVVTGTGRVIGSVYTMISVGLFFGSVIAAFSSYFILTWRKPKRQVIDTITYYLQRIDQLSVEEIDELEDVTAGVLHSARERAEAERRHSPDLEDDPPPAPPSKGTTAG